MKESTDLGLVCLLAFSLMPLLAEPDPVSRRSVPDTGTIVLTDFSGARDWGPELIHFSLDTRRFKPGRLALLDADGKAVPFQVEDGELAFVAVLKKGSSKTWQLQHSDQDRSGENSSLKISRTTDGIEAGNEFFALRMPKAMSKAFPEPVTAAEVPAPLRQWQQNGQGWIGGARLVSHRKVKSYVHSVVRNGPACFEFEARYRFVPKGEYVIRIQISTGVPLAEVTEEYDFGEITDGRDFLMLDLHAGWNPQYIGLIGQQSEARSIPPFTSNPISKYLDGKRKPAASTPPVGGTGNAPSPVVPEAGYVLLEKCVPAGKWGGYRGGIQLWDGDAKNPSAGRRITLGLLSAGSWRKTNSVNLWYREGVGISVALPISVRRIQWSLDIADDVSPFSTHEHDEGLSQSYGRRVWGLYFGDLA
ncbi:MAG: hypothetical protein QF473_32430, partial [Planctomycetota bacterium]|nr:hypothetical protein [Planctomycetota bacterium]